MINYKEESKKYRPIRISMLLVGEAPPPSGKKYFYVPSSLRNHLSIKKDSSLPTTIFHHFFHKRPDDESEYIDMLKKLQAKGIFLVDLVDDPIKVRNNPDGLKKIKDGIKDFRKKLEQRGIIIEDKDITFLLARNTYTAQIRAEFPNSKRITWMNFRMNILT